VNVLYGDNAEGKTNLLEAVYYASIGKSFRGQHTAELIKFGEKQSTISLDYHAGGREQNISFCLYGKTRGVMKNRVKISRISEIVGSFRAVLFCPDHLSLIKEGPAERRQFLDIAISALEPVYLASLQRYHHILKQRNSLIKTAQRDDKSFFETVDIWSEQLAKEGATIAKYRQEYVEKSKLFVKQCFLDMTGEREEPLLCYEGPCGKDHDYSDKDRTALLLAQKLKDNLEREIYAGATLYGIHKDDLDVLLNQKSARAYCSQGQQRSLALALKIAEGELCYQQTGEYPVCLFDDVLSELDRGRREYLLSHIKGKQVIMTTCEKEGFGSSHTILVKNGTYKEV
jgi:DNA replication and repair protein RecF